MFCSVNPLLWSTTDITIRMKHFVIVWNLLLFVVLSQALQNYNELEIIDIVNSELEPLIANAVAQIFDHERLPVVSCVSFVINHIGKCVHGKCLRLFGNEVFICILNTIKVTLSV